MTGDAQEYALGGVVATASVGEFFQPPTAFPAPAALSDSQAAAAPGSCSRRSTPVAKSLEEANTPDPVTPTAPRPQRPSESDRRTWGLVRLRRFGDTAVFPQ
jgi:hypothetical protein